jgi:hypothetical protein
MLAPPDSDRNSVRSKEATFAHFVEVCGMLTIADRKKKRENVDTAGAGLVFSAVSQTECPKCRGLGVQEISRRVPVLPEGPSRGHDLQAGSRYYDNSQSR